MRRFKIIDEKLLDFAQKINAIVSKDRPVFPEGIITFEERRIDWQEEKIRKAIIIQPTFEQNGVNSDLWNFIIVAWKEKNGLAIKPGWNKKLIHKSEFRVIEKNIEELLIRSEEYLKNIHTEFRK